MKMSLALKVEAGSYSETFMSVFKPTRRHILENHNHKVPCVNQNLKFGAEFPKNKKIKIIHSSKKFI